MDGDIDATLGEQVAFYRAWAPSYDEAVRNDANELDRPELRQVLATFHPSGDVLELAGGTGNWTREIVRYADRLTVLDTSPETLAINRASLAESRLRPAYLCADIFEWQPLHRYDVVFFSFWLSHVPLARFDQFWQLVDQSLTSDGRFFFIDSAVPRHEPVPDARVIHRNDDPSSGVSSRMLDDGREYRIVKVHWEPEDLERRLDSAGFRATVRLTGHGQCLYGNGTRHA